MSFRPILADTQDAAWARAERILEETRRLRVAAGYSRGGPQQSEGARRLLAAAEQGSRVDRRLWTEIARETGARHNSTALVGTPEQVAEALLDYFDLGVTTFLIRGFDPVGDAIDYGRELIPRTRALVEQRLAQRQAARLAARDKAVATKREALADLAQRVKRAQAWSYQHVPRFSATLARIIGIPVEAARLQFERRATRWIALDDQVLADQQRSADFYLQVGLLKQRLDVKPTITLV